LGVNPWTGYKVTNHRSYSTIGYGDPAAYRHPDRTRDRGAYNKGFANNSAPAKYIKYLNL